MPKLNKAAYHKGMYLHGGAFSDDGTVAGVPQQRPLELERKPPTPAVDPRLVYLRARTAHLVELSAKLEPIRKQIEALAAKVRSR